MKRIIVLYGTPEDPAAFDRHYERQHVPLCLKMPRLRGFEVSRGPVAVSDPASAYHCVAILSYDSQEDLDYSLASPEGVAAVADVAKFATGGARIVTVETRSFV